MLEYMNNISCMKHFTDATVMEGHARANQATARLSPQTLHLLCRFIGPTGYDQAR